MTLGFDIDKCLKVVKNKYELILLAGARAKEIFNGSQAITKKESHEKSFITALKEISDLNFTYDELNEKSHKIIKQEVFGIQAEKIKKSVDEFDESSLFAKTFLQEDLLLESNNNIDINEFIENDKNDDKNKNHENSIEYEEMQSIKMIGGSFDDMDQENFKDFTDGMDLFDSDEN
jgi:DNA-directed RNA polymerase subunit omega